MTESSDTANEGVDPRGAAPRERIVGALRGQIELAEDFDELPDELRDAFGAP